MLEAWEVERMLAWRRRAAKTASKLRLLGAPDFTHKAANVKLAAAHRSRATCVARKRLPTETGGLF